MVDIENEYQEDYIKKVMNLSFGHMIHHFCLVFQYKLIENTFKYLRDMLDTMVDIENE